MLHKHPFRLFLPNLYKCLCWGFSLTAMMKTGKYKHYPATVLFNTCHWFCVFQSRSADKCKWNSSKFLKVVLTQSRATIKVVEKQNFKLLMSQYYFFLGYSSPHISREAKSSGQKNKKPTSIKKRDKFNYLALDSQYCWQIKGHSDHMNDGLC